MWSDFAMALPSAKLEVGSLSSGGRMEPQRRKRDHEQFFSGKRAPAPFTWKEQLLQLVAIFLTAAVVYKLTVAAVRLVEDARRPFCDALPHPVRDGCRPCPENGICGDGELRCIRGFRREGPLCVSDRQIDRVIQYLAESLEIKVCRMSGNSLCKKDETTWVPEHELWDASMEQTMGLDARSSWLVHEKAVQLVRDKPNIRMNDFGLREFECPIRLALTYQSMGCRIRKDIKANLYGILLTISIAVAVAWCIFRNLEYRRLVNRAEELYVQVFEKGAYDASGETKWVVSSQLRDNLLLSNERKTTALWREVEGLMREDSGTDQYSKLVNGDSCVIWEWQVGALRTPSGGTKR